MREVSTGSGKCRVKESSRKPRNKEGKKGRKKMHACTRTTQNHTKLLLTHATQGDRQPHCFSLVERLSITNTEHLPPSLPPLLLPPQQRGSFFFLLIRGRGHRSLRPPHLHKILRLPPPPLPPSLPSFPTAATTWPSPLHSRSKQEPSAHSVPRISPPSSLPDLWGYSAYCCCCYYCCYCCSLPPSQETPLLLPPLRSLVSVHSLEKPVLPSLLLLLLPLLLQAPSLPPPLLLHFLHYE